MAKAALIETLPPPEATTPMAMLERAVASGASIEMLEKLMGLQERWEKNVARRAFDEAVAKAKAELKPVTRNRKGHNDKKYADFSSIASAVDPIITKYGLSYRFRSAQGDCISVTCILSHKDGHYEETTLSGPADATGNKNAIQAIGSTLTYLQRYSLVQMLGLAAADDDDGNRADLSPISEQQVMDLQTLALDVNADMAKFLRYMKIEKLEDLPVSKLDSAVKALQSKKKAAK